MWMSSARFPSTGMLPFADTYDLEQLELASGSWGIENGALVGRFRGNGGGICYTKRSFPGDILIDFYGTMLSPCNNDLNFVLVPYCGRQTPA